MKLTKQQALAIGANIEARAAEYTNDPAKGYAAGYRPDPGLRMSVQEIGRPRQSGSSRSDYVAWLYGIAQKDLPADMWRIDEGMNRSDLVIFTQE
ncbi:hypothetical protein [Muricoccus aerilatus]|uniref:hypothetical protein n=1 Tax=Muricoccus aerilatus TaxID=452982 RepID=UPI0005C1361D|nr:hypothetical protein [Roseomonas aerilata]